MTLTANNLTLRSATHTDVSTLFIMEKSAHETPWPEATFTQMLNSNNVECFIAEHTNDNEETIIDAFSFIQNAIDEATLLNIVVDKNKQGQGIGRWLLNQNIEQLIQDEEIRSLFLEVRVSNFSAIALYLSCGFTEVGIRNNYYPRKSGGREDGLILALPLEAFHFNEKDFVEEDFDKEN